jgi:hypothetical protein
LYVYKRLLSPNSHLKDEDMESHSNPIMQLPRRIFNRPYWLITRDASKLASLLKFVCLPVQGLDVGIG